jgi:hypothetical protein
MIFFAATYLAFAPLLAGTALLLGGSRLGVRGAHLLTYMVGGGLLTALGSLLLRWGAEGGGSVGRLDFGLWFSLGELRAS